MKNNVQDNNDMILRFEPDPSKITGEYMKHNGLSRGTFLWQLYECVLKVSEKLALSLHVNVLLGHEKC